MHSLAILEDNLDLRLTIEDYFDVSGSFEVVFSSHHPANLISKSCNVHPDFILLDVHLIDVDGVELLSTIKEAFPEARVMIMTGDKDKGLLLRSFKHGASALIYKPFKLTELEAAIQKLALTGSYLEPDVLTRLLNLVHTNYQEQSVKDVYGFTSQEKMIIGMLFDGANCAHIAERLSVTRSQLHRSLKYIYRKAEVGSLIELKNKTEVLKACQRSSAAA